MQLADEGAGIDADHTQQAQAVAAELRALGEAAEAEGGKVPDGVVPAPLKRFIIGIGVRKGEAATATARVVTATCPVVQWAGRTRARETAAQLDALGLHLPELLGGAGDATAPCVACGSEVRRLFGVQPGTPEGKQIVSAANARVGEAAARKVGRQKGRHAPDARGSTGHACDERGAGVHRMHSDADGRSRGAGGESASTHGCK